MLYLDVNNISSCHQRAITIILLINNFRQVYFFNLDFHEYEKKESDYAASWQWMMTLRVSNNHKRSTSI